MPCGQDLLLVASGTHKELNSSNESVSLEENSESQVRSQPRVIQQNLSCYTLRCEYSYVIP